MSEICPKCGLVKELCVCETIAKETQLIKVFLERKKFKKICTIIEGIDQKEIDIKDLARKLKEHVEKIHDIVKKFEATEHDGEKS